MLCNKQTNTFVLAPYFTQDDNEFILFFYSTRL